MDYKKKHIIGKKYIMKYRKNFLDLFKKRKKKEIDPKTKDLYKIFMFVYVNLLVTIFCNIF